MECPGGGLTAASLTVNNWATATEVSRRRINSNDRLSSASILHKLVILPMRWLTANGVCTMGESARRARRLPPCQSKADELDVRRQRRHLPLVAWS
eukprot:4942201-Amphidinium_carterae.1